MSIDIAAAITDGKFRTAYEWTLLGYEAGKAALATENARLLEELSNYGYNRCSICGWPLKESIDAGCVRGNCSQRPYPDTLFDKGRWERERQ